MTPWHHDTTVCHHDPSMDLGTQKVGEVSAVAGEEELDGSLDILIPRFTGHLDSKIHWISGYLDDPVAESLDPWMLAYPNHGIWISGWPGSG